MENHFALHQKHQPVNAYIVTVAIFYYDESWDKSFWRQFGPVLKGAF